MDITGGNLGFNGHHQATKAFTCDEVFLKHIDPQTGEVEVSSPVIKLNDYLSITPPEDRLRLLGLANSLKGRKISFVNATAAGGGVAIMRTAQRFLLKELGVDVRWFVTEPNEEAFKITKGCFHNVFQGVADNWLTDADMEIYRQWTGHNAQRMEAELAKSDIVVIDDPQPSGLIPHIKKINPNVKIIFRNHIHSLGNLMGKKGTVQNHSWQFLWKNGISRADLYVYHPVEDFIPANVAPEKTVLMPPSTDPLDGLNRNLTDEEIRRGLEFINEKLELNGHQNPIDLGRRYITQIARFDPSKGIPDVLEAYSLFYKKMTENGFTKASIPQLVIAGNGSVDDPDGIPVLEDTMKKREHLYKDIADDIKVVRIPHNDQALNALLRASFIVLQLSTREGFEFKVTEAIMKGKPVIASEVGGIPLQIIPGESGYVVKPGDTRQVAEHLFSLVTQPEMYRRLSTGALRLASAKNYEFTTVPNLINWLWLFRELLENPDFKGNRQNVKDLVDGGRL